MRRATGPLGEYHSREANTPTAMLQGGVRARSYPPITDQVQERDRNRGAHPMFGIGKTQDLTSSRTGKVDPVCSCSDGDGLPVTDMNRASGGLIMLMKAAR